MFRVMCLSASGTYLVTHKLNDGFGISINMCSRDAPKFFPNFFQPAYLVSSYRRQSDSYLHRYLPTCSWWARMDGPDGEVAADPWAGEVGAASGWDTTTTSDIPTDDESQVPSSEPLACGRSFVICSSLHGGNSANTSSFTTIPAAAVSKTIPIGIPTSSNMVRRDA